MRAVRTTITYDEWITLPKWMKHNLCECKKCNSPVSLFYDENKRYHIECCECSKTLAFSAKSLEEAREHWNKSSFSNDKYVILN